MTWYIFGWILFGVLIGYALHKEEMEKDERKSSNYLPYDPDQLIFDLQQEAEEKQAERKDKEARLASDKSIWGKIRFKIYTLTNI